MLGSDFIDSYKKYQAASLIGIQDWADRMSYVHSTIIFVICTTIVTAKTYILKPLACHVPTTPSGAKFDDYFDSYCWVHGTTPLRMNESLPEIEANWINLETSRKITYYQWVPFVLGLQTIMFYIPYICWQNITFNRLGTDLTAIITKAMNALSSCSPETRTREVTNVAKRLELLLFAHRDNRRGRLADMRRNLHKACGIFLVSKRMGTWTVFSYLCIKLLYLANAIFQLYLMKYFLGFEESMFAFGLHLAQLLTSGEEWMESLYFPRLSFCSITMRHLGQNNNRFVGMCALAINMLNEKLYIFLWFWVLSLTIATAISILVWISRLFFRRRQANVIRKYLKLTTPVDDKTPTVSESRDGDALDPDDPKTAELFIKDFLRLDGVFIVQMLTLNAGDIITGEVVRLLWQAWLDKYSNREFDNDPWWNYEYPLESEEKLESVN